MAEQRVGQGANALSTTSKNGNVRKKDGDSKSASNASNGQHGNELKNKKHDKQVSSRKKINNDNEDLNLSGSFLNDPDFDTEANMEILRKTFEKKILLIQTEFQAKVDTLHEVLKTKDDVIGKLQSEIGHLKQTCNYLTEETTTLKGQLNIHEVSLTEAGKKYNTIVDKTADLEDRSRRNNLVFYNIPEPEVLDKESCEDKILKLIDERGIFESGYVVPIDRAHRLGRKKDEPDARPRPLIVRFTYFKDKESIILNGRKFKGTRVAVSEDFSKLTLSIHQDLRRQAQKAQGELDSQHGQQKAITHYKVTYRRLLLTYTTNKNNPTATKFTRSFSPDYISKNKDWYMPLERNTYAKATTVHRQA